MKAVNSRVMVLALVVLVSSWPGETVLAADKAQPANSPQVTGGTSSGSKPPGDNSNRIEFENKALKMIVMPRTREQMKAFYEGRGFPEPAINAIAEACFMTVVVKNKTKDILWLELDNWAFNSETPGVKRLDRAYWKQRWEILKIPKANRSTFGWTLLPEQRDLRVDEGVGGNITMTFTTQPFAIDARFYLGGDKHGGPISVHLTKIQCAR
jgi:hypothetical protein